MTFGSQLQSGSYLEELWHQVQPSFYDGKVTTRAESYLLFSQVLKITRATQESELLTRLWLDALSIGSFSLCPIGEEEQKFTFITIINLINSKKQDFDITFEEVKPDQDNLEAIAEAVHSICTCALGKPPSIGDFLNKIKSPDTFLMMAKHSKDYIACAYGTLIPFSRGNIFHFNILARKISYPSIHILDKFNKHLPLLFQRFPKINFFTLNVKLSNSRMIEPYEKQRFQNQGLVKSGPDGVPAYFYVKKIDPNCLIEPPSYAEFKIARERSQQK